MRNGKRLPLGILGALLLIGLAAMGVANGLWSKNLNINGVVETGDLNVDWSLAVCSELHNWPGFPGSTPGGLLPGEKNGKNVGWVTSQIGDPVFGDQVVTITLHNAYPSYVIDCEMEWINTGTIPVNFSGFTIVPGAGLPPIGPNATDCHLTGTTTKVLSCPQLTVIYVDGIGSQVDPCGDDPNDPFDQLSCPAAQSLRVHVEEAAPQNHCTGVNWGIPQAFDPTGQVVTGGWNTTCTPAATALTFHVKLCMAQWNEAATFSECANSLQHEGPP